MARMASITVSHDAKKDGYGEMRLRPPDAGASGEASAARRRFGAAPVAAAMLGTAAVAGLIVYFACTGGM